MKLYRKGAEANLYLGDSQLVKKRVEKKYRLPALDKRLRKRRTRGEAKNIERARKAGIKAPRVLRVDEKAYTIEMEYVEGRLVKDVFDRGERIEELSREIGSMLRRLHDSKLVHNDLTTSNLILGDDGVYVIDFGLAYHTTRLEDKAMDLVVFKKSIMATHTIHADKIWVNLVEGYQPGKEMLKRVETIENRVRYK